MLEKIEQLIAEINGLKVQSAEELEALRLKYLSKKGAINDLMADFRNVPNDQKREIGQKLNELKNLAQDKINSLKGLRGCIFLSHWQLCADIIQCVSGLRCCVSLKKQHQSRCQGR